MFDTLEFRYAYEWVPNLQPVTFLSRIPGNQPQFYAYTLFRAQRKKLTKEEILVNGLLGLTMLKWQLWQEALDNAIPLAGAPMPVPTPKVSDAVEDSKGVVWIAKFETNQLFRNVHELICQKKLANQPV